MKKAQYGRLDVNCPGCGSLRQIHIKDLEVHVDPTGDSPEDKINIVDTCRFCGLEYRVALAVYVEPVEPEEEPKIDTTPKEKVDELAEKTRTRVTPKSMSKRAKAASRKAGK